MPMATSVWSVAAIPAYFRVGDVREATELVERASTDRAFLRRLASACRARAWLFNPKVERAAVRDLVHQLLHNRPRFHAADPPDERSLRSEDQADVLLARRRLRLQDRARRAGRDPQGLARPVPPQLLVGIETSDDAAVYQINDEQALIATTDFFMPIVDDPYDFGRIAATNAISDVYAMGGTPIMALALLAHAGQPAAARSDPPHRRGRRVVCAAAGIPIAGGHTIDSVEPIYGLVALGLVHPKKVKKQLGRAGG